MADDSGSEVSTRTETTALQDALAAEHTAVWGYGVVGAALAGSARQPAADSEAAHRNVRDRLVALLEQRKTDPVPAKAGYTLPFPVLSAVDAAKLAVVLEDGVESAWVHVLGGAADHDVRGFAVDTLSATEVRAVVWRTTAGQTPVTAAFPGLPEQ